MQETVGRIRDKYPIAAAVVGFLGVLICGGLVPLLLFFSGRGSGKPAVTILSPAPDASFVAGAVVLVEALASGQGIERIELWIDGELVDVAVSDTPQDSFRARLEWEAAGPGTYTLEAIARTESGQRSDPASVTVEVTGQIAEITPTPTALSPFIRTPTPTSAFSPTPTFTSTPTFTPTPTPTPQLSFAADDQSLVLGECTNLRWDVRNVQAVYLITGGGTPQGVPGENQVRQVCPTTTTTYTLRVEKRDGNTEERAITSTVTPLRVRVKFTGLTVFEDTDSDDPFCFTDCGAGEIWLEVDINGTACRVPQEGEYELNNGESVSDNLRDCPEVALSINDDLVITVVAWDQDFFSEDDQLGTVTHTHVAGENWETGNPYTFTADTGNFEVTYTVDIL